MGLVKVWPNVQVSQSQPCNNKPILSRLKSKKGVIWGKHIKFFEWSSPKRGWGVKKIFQNIDFSLDVILQTLVHVCILLHYFYIFSPLCNFWFYYILKIPWNSRIRLVYASLAYICLVWSCIHWWQKNYLDSGQMILDFCTETIKLSAIQKKKIFYLGQFLQILNNKFP